MQYVLKLGAYGLAGVAAFAVAFAVLVSAPTAEAEVRQTATGSGLSGGDLTRSNGDTVYINNDNGSDTIYVRFTIETTGKATASFTHSSATDEGQSILCNGGGACDAEKAETDNVTVALKIDDDSGAGAIFVRQATVASTPQNELDTITVEVAQVPTKLALKLADRSIDSGQGTATAGETTLDIRLTDANGKGIADKAITIVSTRALLEPSTELSRTINSETVTVGSIASGTAAALAGTATTTADGDDDVSSDDVDTAGWVRVAVKGGGTPGVSTITATVGSVTGTAQLVLHGPVKTLTAMAQQSAIEVGGMTYIVVTATDSAGNPVAKSRAGVKSGATGVVGPSSTGNEVSVANNMNKDGGTKGTVQTGDYPACGGGITAVDANADDENSPVVGVFASIGTNGDGKCVLQVDAGSADGTSDDAARGAHEITIVALSGDTGTTANTKVEAVKLSIDVGGAPDDILHDAPERIDPSAELTVNITVLDDQGVRVGSTAIEVLKTAGDGAIISEVSANTSDGRAKFSYIAPSTPGVVEFLVRTKDAKKKVTAKEPIIIQIGAEVEPPAPPEVVEVVTPPGIVGFNPSAGQSGLVSFTNLSSIDDALGLIGCGDQTGASVSLTLMDGTPVIYAVGAPDFANRGFTDNVEFPIAFAAAYVSCP